MKTLKKNKQERVFDILELNTGLVMTPAQVNAALNHNQFAVPSEQPWSVSTIYQAAYNSAAKGNPIFIIKDGHTLIGFKHVMPKKPEPVIDEETLEDSADNALETIQKITKPIDLAKEDDLFSDEEIREIAEPLVIPDGGITEQLDKTESDFAAGGYVYEHLDGGAIAPAKHVGFPDELFTPLGLPEITDDAVMHLIKANRPVPVTPLMLQTHFGVSPIEAIALLLNVQERGFRGIEVMVSAVAL